MALKLIRRGPRTLRVSPGAGTGWRYIKDGTWQYLLAGSGWCVVTATATHCAGVRIEDANYPVPRPTQAGDATASLVADLTSTRTVMVAVLDPTSDTEVIVTAIPIPPPLPRRGFSRLGRWLPWR